MGVEGHPSDGYFGFQLAPISQPLVAFYLVLIMSHIYSLGGSTVHLGCKIRSTRKLYLDRFSKVNLVDMGTYR